MKFREQVEHVISTAEEASPNCVMLPLGSWNSIVDMLRRQSRKYTANRGGRGRDADTLNRIAKDCPTYTPREQKVAELIHIGLTDKQIGERMGITCGTVKVMVKKCKQRCDGYHLRMLREMQLRDGRS